MCVCIEYRIATPDIDQTLTLLFLCVISFNIHLTSGTWNSVILYAQIIDCFQVNSLQLFDPPHGILELTSIYRFIFGWFNFNFFKFDDYLSFCIWDGMTVLEVLAVCDNRLCSISAHPFDTVLQM